jgi:hypothetical protein
MSALLAPVLGDDALREARSCSPRCTTCRATGAWSSMRSRSASAIGRVRCEPRRAGAGAPMQYAAGQAASGTSRSTSTSAC